MIKPLFFHSIRSFCSLFFALFVTFQSYAQQPPDTLTAELEGLVVTGYQSNRDILESTGSIAFVPLERIAGLDNGSLVYGLNTVAGVRMEERAPGSYRLAIRGSSLRSPFGIRNVKVYWNDIPLTEPSGSTFLNLLDPVNMQQAEVLKGPSGSIYGAGNGGVVLLESTPPVVGSRITNTITTGSFGLLRNQLMYDQQFDRGWISLKYAVNTSDGYREQSSLDRQVIELSTRTEYASGKALEASFLYSDLNYGIPGGLTLEQFQADPTQARQGNRFVQGSVESNAGIDQQQALFRVTHDLDLQSGFSNRTSVFGTFSEFDNPFNLDYKVDSRKSGGLRSVFHFSSAIAELPFSFSSGVEYQVSAYDSRNYGNIGGSIDTLNFDDQIGIQTFLAFTSAQIDLPRDWIFTAGLSLNTLNYDIDRLFAAAGYGETGEVIRIFEPRLIPRIGLTKRLSPTFSFHSSLGFGFSPPTIEEVRTNEGSINRQLEAETGTNYELGFRGYTPDGRLNVDVTGFIFRLNDAIVQQESERGTVLFRNAGSTLQSGLETQLSYLILDRYEGFLRRIKISTAYTFNRFRFDEYDTSDGDFSGNELTGIPDHVIVSTLTAESRGGLYLRLTHNYTDDIPLNDANSVYSDPFHLVQGRIGVSRSWNDRWESDLYLGADNLLNEQYSLGFDVNAFGNRYYQPAPERNWFLGVRVSRLL